MAKPLVSDGLWARIEPLLPQAERRFRYPGRKRLDDRQVLTGILFVLKTGIPWEDLPQEMGCGSGMTCWRRLRDWNEAGVWERLHQALLDELQDAGQLDWSRAIVDSSHVRAKGGAKRQGPRPSTGAGRAQSTIDLRGEGCPLGRDVDSWKSQRHHRVAGARGQGPADWPLRQVPAKGAARRPRLRQPPSPQGTTRTRHHATDRQAQHHTRLRARQRTLGSGAHHLMATPPATPRPPL